MYQVWMIRTVSSGQRTVRGVAAALAGTGALALLTPFAARAAGSPACERVSSYLTTEFHAKDRLNAGQCLKGEGTALVMQADGNLVLYL